MRLLRPRRRHARDLERDLFAGRAALDAHPDLRAAFPAVEAPRSAAGPAGCWPRRPGWPRRPAGSTSTCSTTSAAPCRSCGACPAVVTIHDLQPLHHPEPSARSSAGGWPGRCPPSVRHARLVVAVSRLHGRRRPRAPRRRRATASWWSATASTRTPPVGGRRDRAGPRPLRARRPTGSCTRPSPSPTRTTSAWCGRSPRGRRATPTSPSCSPAATARGRGRRAGRDRPARPRRAGAAHRADPAARPRRARSPAQPRSRSRRATRASACRRPRRWRCGAPVDRRRRGRAARGRRRRRRPARPARRRRLDAERCARCWPSPAPAHADRARPGAGGPPSCTVGRSRSRCSSRRGGMR